MCLRWAAEAVLNSARDITPSPLVSIASNADDDVGAKEEEEDEAEADEAKAEADSDEDSTASNRSVELTYSDELAPTVPGRSDAIPLFPVPSAA